LKPIKRPHTPQTEVAVKILTSQAGAAATGAAGSGRDAAELDGDAASWDDQQLQRLAKEVDILANLRHPNVLSFLGVSLQPPCVVTEFCALGASGFGGLWGVGGDPAWDVG